MSPQFLEVQEVNSTDGKPMGRVLIGLQHVVYVIEPTKGRPTRFAEIVSAGPGGFCKTYTDANYDEVAERLAATVSRVNVPPPRIHVADLDPDALDEADTTPPHGWVYYETPCAVCGKTVRVPLVRKQTATEEGDARLVARFKDGLDEEELESIKHDACSDGEFEDATPAGQEG